MASNEDKLYEKLTVDSDDEEDIHVIEHEGETAQVGWNEEQNEGASELGGHWIFSASWQKKDEEWKDIRRDDRDVAIDRLKRRVVEHF